MKKYDLIKAIIELEERQIISPAHSYYYIKQIVEKTFTGSNKNSDKRRFRKWIKK